MIKLIIYFIVILFSLQLNAQKVNNFSLEVNYGMQGNYFVRSYDEINRPSSVAFFNKNFIGTTGGIELLYHATERASWGIGFAKSTNKRTVNYNSIYNGVPVVVKDFEISHENRFYQVFYQRIFSKKIPKFKYEIGLYYLRSQQQEFEIFNAIIFEQRNYKNSSLEEGGSFIGFQYETMIDKKFALGIKSRLYYTISTEEMEILTFTPTLTYHF